MLRLVKMVNQVMVNGVLPVVFSGILGNTRGIWAVKLGTVVPVSSSGILYQWNIGRKIWWYNISGFHWHISGITSGILAVKFGGIISVASTGISVVLPVEYWP